MPVAPFHRIYYCFQGLISIFIFFIPQIGRYFYCFTWSSFSSQNYSTCLSFPLLPVPSWMFDLFSGIIFLLPEIHLLAGPVDNKFHFFVINPQFVCLTITLYLLCLKGSFDGSRILCTLNIVS